MLNTVVPAAAVGAQGPGPTVPPADPAPPASEPTAPPAPPEPPPLLPLPELSPALARVRVTSPAYDAATARRDAAQEALADAAERELTEGTDMILLTQREEELTARIGRARARAERAEDTVDELTRSLRDVAASSYMNGTGEDPFRGLDTDTFEDRAKTDVAVSSLARRQITELETARRTARTNRTEEQISHAVREGVRKGILDAEAARAQAVSDKARLAVEVVEAAQEAEGESRLATVVGADFPLVVLDAYWKAAEAMRFLQPACGIAWWALAGIGRVESGHGTHAGAAVRPDGSLTKPIIGIPLTGSGGTARIGDSDGGLIDGDAVLDRAAGPMQFIPQTWARWGGDGNGDGVRDIQNLYDATVGAAAYLCASGPLTDDAGLSRAYFSYNHSLAYVANVLAGAKRYALEVEI